MPPSMRGCLRWLFGEGGHRPGDIKISSLYLVNPFIMIITKAKTVIIQQTGI